MEMLISLTHSILLDKYSEMESLDHMVVLFLFFGLTSILFSVAVVPFYIPTNGARVPVSPNPHQHLGIIFDNSPKPFERNNSSPNNFRTPLGMEYRAWA
jgi:hypothetical protein